jgi:hypothetical protein
MDAGHVTHRLWQGSVPTAGRHLPFDLVVLCAQEHQFPIAVYGVRPFGPRARVLRCPLTDGGAPLSNHGVSRAFGAAVEVARAYMNGERVVVTCQAGLNRSGLVVALALLEMGVDAPSAVQAVRRARPGGLGNVHFEHLIYSVAGRSMIRVPIRPIGAYS